MLIITDDQITHLSALSRADFIGRADRLLRSRFEEAAAVPDGELNAPIEALTDKALGYGLVMEPQALAYIVTGWLLGLEFDTDFPAARFMLASPDYTPAEKADWLENWTVRMFKLLAPSSSKMGG
ncbi:hypothetical protein [Azospirillum endophyticum]